MNAQQWQYQPVPSEFICSVNNIKAEIEAQRLIRAMNVNTHFAARTKMQTFLEAQLKATGVSLAEAGTASCSDVDVLSQVRRTLRDGVN